jgi:hypothetical protein
MNDTEGEGYRDAVVVAVDMPFAANVEGGRAEENG